jgi:S1 RNA binding domain protein
LATVLPIEVGSIVEGVVTGITHFGAFIELPNGKTGLVHISEVADTYVRDIKDFLKEQDKVKVKVLSYDEKGKIGLSIKQADPSYRPVQASRGPRDGGGIRRGSGSFEDKLAKFLKDSEDKLSDLRRNTDGKRGGRGGGRKYGLGD